MIIKRNILKNVEFTNSKILRIIFLNVNFKRCSAFCLNDFTKYRIRNDSLQSSNLKILLIWKINKEYNKFNF